MSITRRDFGRAALAAGAIGALRAAINSKIQGVQLGAQTYSFNTLEKDPPSIVQAFVDCQLGLVELMSNHCELLAGIPRTPRDAVAKWRAAATPETWAAVRRKFSDAGANVAILCYNTNDKMSEGELEYGFTMAKGLGVKTISTSTTVTNAKRLALMAKSHKITVAYHGHDETSKPNEVATLESYDAIMALGDYNMINLDIGHFAAANYDAVDFIRKHHDRISHLHVKDRKRDHGPAVPFGEGNTPIRAVLQLMKKEKYPFPGMIEMEYPIPADSNAVAEVKKCFAYCKEALS